MRPDGLRYTRSAAAGAAPGGAAPHNVSQLVFDAEEGRYVGRRLIVSASALMRRIRERTVARLQPGVDPAVAAEAAWAEALDEDGWRLDDEGVVPRPGAPA